MTTRIKRNKVEITRKCITFYFLRFKMWHQPVVVCLADPEIFVFGGKVHIYVFVITTLFLVITRNFLVIFKRGTDRLSYRQTLAAQEQNTQADGSMKFAIQTPFTKFKRYHCQADQWSFLLFFSRLVHFIPFLQRY